jgi:hypothetical protein
MCLSPHLCVSSDIHLATTPHTAFRKPSTATVSHFGPLCIRIFFAFSVCDPQLSCDIFSTNQAWPRLWLSRCNERNLEIPIEGGRDTERQTIDD